MNYPKVSVIIPVYNGEKYVAQAIESALSQTYNNVEIIVINDGSTDNSYNKIKPYLSSVKYIYQENKGAAVARNTGIENSTGELIGFLDADDLWLPEKLEIQVDYLLRNKDIGLVHSNRISIYEEGTKAIPDPPSTKAIGMCFKQLFNRNQISTSTVLLRKKCLIQVGGFDERFVRAQDYELWLRISKFYPIGYIDQRLSCYRQHSSNVSRNWEHALLAKVSVIESILDKFPEIYQELGDSIIKNKLYNLYYRAANYFLHIDKRKQARKYYLKALNMHPAKWNCWGKLLIGSFLTPKQKSILQWYKQKVSKLFHW